METFALLLSDVGVLRFFNESNNLFIDQVALLLTSGYTWIPLYIALFCVVVHNNETMPQIGLALGGAILCVLITSGVDNLLVKPLVERPRPCCDPVLKYTFHIVDGLRPRDFSFFSAHAANTMSLAVFVSLLMRSRQMAVVLGGWSLVNCWTRLYLGVHYPTDILCGLFFGALVGGGMYMLYCKAYYRISPNIKYISSQYTVTGYDHDDIDATTTVASFIFVYVMLRACVMAGMV